MGKRTARQEGSTQSVAKERLEQEEQKEQKEEKEGEKRSGRETGDPDAELCMTHPFHFAQALRKARRAA
ncbi:MAG TPA: hypothetical protein IAC12_08500 [Candidatus Aphodovivens avistercoris]|nr:hypothetical protein [Candidatus Aphodovivens avistercoris]